MPLQRNISPHKAVPCLKPFETEEFIKTLEHSGPQLTSGLKGNWVGLYRCTVRLIGKRETKETVVRNYQFQAP